MKKEMLAPDMGGKVDVIEILAKVGDMIKKDDALMTVESDKASMDIPSTMEGKLLSFSVKVGDKITEGALLGFVEMASEGEVSTPHPSTTSPTSPSRGEVMQPKSSQEFFLAKGEVKPSAAPAVSQSATGFVDSLYAGPAVRRLAREFGADLSKVTGSGEKGRITKEDLQAFVKSRLQSGGSSAGFAFPEMPVVDFTKFGAVQISPLSKIKKLSGANLHRNWVGIPHITQFDEADITSMEAVRETQKVAAEKQGFKLTPIVFVMKAVVTALKKYPQFNASLDSTGENLVLKQYYHIGVAVDTPNGLVVPVIRDVDRKGIMELAKELTEVSKRAREKGLTPMDMQGGCFSISSLGGIGGTAFTPIINAPEVAILGLSKSSMKPVWNGKDFEARLMLPLSLSYDHRVIDGAEAARFISFLSDCLKNAWNMI
jgi:pyruvate dehydrogenase E2 component (dihydrolipoamide acetyltransferase)